MKIALDPYPKRIICLTEEPTEMIYLLGEEERIVGISGFTMRPKRARKEKPKVSLFTSSKIDEIIALEPDLVIGFSDIQADIARELIAKGITVWINNHRSVEDIYAFMIQMGSLIGKGKEAQSIVSDYKADIIKLTNSNRSKNRRPKIYFEEWYDPLISGIRWVSELIEIAGGEDVFNEFQNTSLAKDRIIADHNEVIKRNPDIIIGSWCGKKFKKETVVNREGWDSINAVKHNHIYEIKSEFILQPGPAAVSEGIKQITEIIENWHLAQ